MRAVKTYQLYINGQYVDPVEGSWFESIDPYRGEPWARIPRAGATLSLQIARMVEAIRKEDLRKVPGVAETLDWAAALVGLDVDNLQDRPETVHETLMCLLKTREDSARMARAVTDRLLGKVA